MVGTAWGAQPVPTLPGDLWSPQWCWVPVLPTTFLPCGGALGSRCCPCCQASRTGSGGRWGAGQDTTPRGLLCISGRPSRGALCEQRQRTAEAGWPTGIAGGGGAGGKLRQCGFLCQGAGGQSGRSHPPVGCRDLGPGIRSSPWVAAQVSQLSAPASCAAGLGRRVLGSAPSPRESWMLADLLFFGQGVFLKSGGDENAARPGRVPTLASVMGPNNSSITAARPLARAAGSRPVDINSAARTPLGENKGAPAAAQQLNSLSRQIAAAIDGRPPLCGGLTAGVRTRSSTRTHSTGGRARPARRRDHSATPSKLNQ